MKKKQNKKKRNKKKQNERRKKEKKSYFQKFHHRFCGNIAFSTLLVYLYIIKRLTESPTSHHCSGYVGKLQITCSKVRVFTRYPSFIHHLDMESHNLA